MKFPLISFAGLLVLTLGPAIFPKVSYAQTGQVIFNHTFTNDSGLPANWESKLDGSVGCASPANTPDDVSTYVTTDNWPGHGRVMTVHANVHAEKVTVANSLAVRSFNYLGGGNYQADFDMRLWQIDATYQNNYYGMNLTVARNAVEHFAEVNIETNPTSADYGYLMYKRTGTGGTERVRVSNDFIGVNTNWHHLTVNIQVDTSTNYYVLESIQIDGGAWHVLHEPLPTRSTPWPDFSNFFVESHSRVTGCQPNTGPYVGIALFDNVKLTYFPW
jgi:hypothetical protein